MPENDFYYTIETSGSAETKERGSKFIAYAYPIENVEDFKKHFNESKNGHPRATHHCFAYRIGTDGNNFRVNDDGEPPGTAGKPILGQIDSKKLVNIAVIVVRYFGGTLLDKPGLISAYKSATALVLQTLPSVKKNMEEEIRVEFDYTLINIMISLVKQNSCRIVSQELQLFCKMNIAIPRNNAEQITRKFKGLHNVVVIKIGSI